MRLTLQDFLPLLIQIAAVLLWRHSPVLSLIASGVELELGIWFILFHSTTLATGFSPPAISNFLPQPAVFICSRYTWYQWTLVAVTLPLFFIWPFINKLNPEILSCMRWLAVVCWLSIRGQYAPCESGLGMWVRGAALLIQGQIGSPSQSQSASVSVWSLELCAIQMRGLSVFVQLGVKSIFTYWGCVCVCTENVIVSDVILIYSVL